MCIEVTQSDEVLLGQRELLKVEGIRGRARVVRKNLGTVCIKGLELIIAPEIRC